MFSCFRSFQRTIACTFWICKLSWVRRRCWGHCTPRGGQGTLRHLRWSRPTRKCSSAPAPCISGWENNLPQDLRPFSFPRSCQYLGKKRWSRRILSSSCMSSAMPSMMAASNSSLWVAIQCIKMGLDRKLSQKIAHITGPWTTWIHNQIQGQNNNYTLFICTQLPPWQLGRQPVVFERTLGLMEVISSYILRYSLHFQVEVIPYCFERSCTHLIII